MFNNVVSQLRGQLRRHQGKTVVLYTTAVTLVLAIVIINRLFSIPVASLVRDPTSVGAISPWTGAFSNIGVLFWCAAMTLAFAAAALVSHQPATRKYLGFLVASGLITGALMLDDLFLLHESFRNYLGFPERASFAIMLTAIAAYLWFYGRVILTTDYFFLVVAFLFLGASLGLDNMQLAIMLFVPDSIYYLAEDGLKLVGIISWFGYFSGLYSRIAAGQLEPFPLSNNVS